jgi:hypothetical protein
MPLIYKARQLYAQEPVGIDVDVDAIFTHQCQHAEHVHVREMLPIQLGGVLRDGQELFGLCRLVRRAQKCDIFATKPSAT